MKIAIGCDHGGFSLKGEVIEVIESLGHEILDLGTCSLEPVDYVDFAVSVANAVASGQADLGVLTCGTGIGMSIAANKITGAYAARAEDCYSARMARLHNGANILCIGARTTGPELAKEALRTFLTTEPSPDERHARRRAKIRALEANK
ncbi:MAG: ribose 5-phosphate isomerase B [Armatimonadia bacterium]